MTFFFHWAPCQALCGVIGTVCGTGTYLAGWILAVIVPELCFQDFGWHGFDILFGVIFGDGGEDKQTFPDGGDQLTVNGHGGRLDTLKDSWMQASEALRRVHGVDTYSSWRQGGVVVV